MMSRALLILAALSLVGAVRHRTSMAQTGEAPTPAMKACAKVKKGDCKHFKAKRHQEVPPGYKCAWMKLCMDGTEVAAGPVKTTAECGKLRLRAKGVCVAVGGPKRQPLKQKDDVSVGEEEFHDAKDSDDEEEEFYDFEDGDVLDDEDDEDEFHDFEDEDVFHEETVSGDEESEDDQVTEDSKVIEPEETSKSVKDAPKEDVPEDEEEQATDDEEGSLSEEPATKESPQRAWYSWPQGIPSVDSAQPMMREEMEESEEEPKTPQIRFGLEPDVPEENIEDESEAPPKEAQELAQPIMKEELEERTDTPESKEQPSNSWWGWGWGSKKPENVDVPVEKSTRANDIQDDSETFPQETDDEDEEGSLSEEPATKESPQRAWYSWPQGIPSVDNAQPMMREEMEEPEEEPKTPQIRFGLEPDVPEENIEDESEAPPTEQKQSWFSWAYGNPTVDNAKPMMKEEPKETQKVDVQEAEEEEEDEEEEDEEEEDEEVEEEEDEEEEDEEEEDEEGPGDSEDPDQANVKSTPCGHENFGVQQFKWRGKMVTICRNLRTGRFAKKLCCDL